MQGLELIYVAVIGAGLALGVRYLVPGRSAHGLLLLPAIGVWATTIVWVGLIWLGWTSEGGWIWLVSLVVATAAAVASAIVLARVRATTDERRLHVLSRGRA